MRTIRKAIFLIDMVGVFLCTFWLLYYIHHYQLIFLFFWIGITTFVSFTIYLGYMNWKLEIYIDHDIPPSKEEIKSKGYVGWSQSAYDYYRQEGMSHEEARKGAFIVDSGLKSPPIIKGKGAEIFYDEMDNMEYSDELKEFYKRPIRFDTSEIEKKKED